MIDSIGLYIHIPFCKSKCYYCDFNSYANMEEVYAEYFNALNTEITLFAKDNRYRRIKSIYIGGGTPSCVDPMFIRETMKTIVDNYNMEQNAEISMEANPGTLTEEKLTIYKENGINRLSIGLQAWQDRLLLLMGRIHNQEQFLDNFKMARKVGFDNINVDVIFALPTQTEKDWKQTIEKIADLDCEHVSCYGLTIEEGTEFSKMANEGKIIPVDEQLDRKMYHFAVKRLIKNSFEHYEISNFAKPGFQCIHNMIYWKAEEYKGFGAGSHSYISNERYNNPYKINEYIDAVKLGEPLKINTMHIDKNESMSEYMILGLRLIEGIRGEDFEKRYDENMFDVYKSQIEALSAKGLVVVEKGKIKLSEKGLDIANQALVEFI